MGFLSIALWSFEGSIAPVLLLVIGVIEFVGPILHVVPFVEHLGLETRIVLTAILFAAALGTLHHHHRLEEDVKRYRVLLATMEAILDYIREGSAQKTSDVPVPGTVAGILAILVSALQTRHSRISAAIIVQERPGEPYAIYSSMPQHSFANPNDGILNKFADLIVRDPSGATGIYVPSTRFNVAVKFIRKFTKQGVEDVAERIVMVESPIERSGPAQSLFFAGIPAHSRMFSGIDDLHGVLCVATSARDGINSTGFAAIKLAATVLSLAALRLKE